MSTLPSQPIDQAAPSASQQAVAKEAESSAPKGSWGPLPPLGSDPAVRASIPPLIMEAQTVFFQDLPELLKHHPGKWVAYYGTQRIGIFDTEDALDEECLRRGYQEYFVRLIYPYPEMDFISAL